MFGARLWDSLASFSKYIQRAYRKSEAYGMARILPRGFVKKKNFHFKRLVYVEVDEMVLNLETILSYQRTQRGQFQSTLLT